MTTQQHLITPPRELVEKWATSSPIQYSDESWAYELFIAHQAARWGADQELEACCEWLHWQNLATHSELIPSLRAARRPRPLSLKDQALNELDLTADPNGAELSRTQVELIRRALEALPND